MPFYSYQARTKGSMLELSALAGDVGHSAAYPFQLQRAAGGSNDEALQGCLEEPNVGQMDLSS